jgi:quercetin dioxygenase-like cupin family protein
MTERTVHAREEDYPWESDDGDPDAPDVLHWRILISAVRTPSHGLSMGTFEAPPGAELAVHHHSPQEVYYVVRGEAEVFQDGEWRPLHRGEVLYFPGNAVHGVRNHGQERVVIVWIFPTDTYEEIEYIDA